MARDVIIKINVQDKNLDTTINKLKQLGIVDEKNGEKFEKTGKKFRKTQDDNATAIGKLNGVIGNAGKMIAGVFAVQSLIGFGKKIIDITSEFQKMEAVLTNTLGSSSAATMAMSMIQDFAAKTPFSVTELTASFVKLANQGFKPTADEMRKLGDLASSTGKGFDQLAEAMIDAQTGEFERLKEFGIRAQKEGDKVAFTFKGVKTEVDFTNDSIRNYITGLGDAEGVSGAMAAISETLGGKISNLGDSWDSYMRTLGEANKGILAETIQGLNDLISAINETDNATNRINELGFDRGYFQDVKGAALVALELDKAVKANVATFYEAGVSVESVNAAITNYLKAQQAADTSTKEGRAQVLIYSDAIKILRDRIVSLNTDADKAKAAADAKALEASKKASEKSAAERLKAQKAADAEVEKQKAASLAIMRKYQDEYEKYLEDTEKRRVDIQKQRDDLAVSMIEDDTTREITALMAKFDEEIALLDEQKEDEAALILEKKQKLEDDITGVIEESSKKRTKIAQDEAQKQLAANLNVLHSVQQGTNDLLGTFSMYYDSRIAQIDEQAANEQITDEEAQRRKKALLREQAEIQKATAMFNTIIKIAEAIMVATTAGPIAGQILAGATAALGALQLGIIASTPIPAFKHGTKGKKGSGLSRVGEEGEELMFVPDGAKILPHKQTAQYSEMIDAMYDNKLDDYILKSYLPRILPNVGDTAKNKNFIDALTNNLGANGFSGDEIVDTLNKMDKNENKRTMLLANAIISGNKQKPNFRRI